MKFIHILHILIVRFTYFTMNKLKGDTYEYSVRNLFSKTETIWLWQEVPESVLRKIGYIGDWNEYRINKRTNKINNLPDLGCDLILFSNNKYCCIQCKNYESRNVTLNDLGTFYFLIYKYNLIGKVFYSKSISRNILDHKNIKIISDGYAFDDKIQYIKQPLINLKYNFPMNKLNEKLLNNPYYYQVDAYNELKNKNRTILQLPCGMGKTLIGIMLAKDYKQIIILSPLKAHAKQNLNRYQNELSNYNGLLVNSDNIGTRNTIKIKNFIHRNDDIILSFTYQSCDILIDIIKLLNNYIIIIDEFHNLSYNEITTYTPLSNLLNNIEYKILFMSATPRLYDDDENEIINYKIFGNIDYSFDMGKAIKENYICDYNIYLPDISKKIIETGVKEIFNINDFTADEQIIIKAKYILRASYEIGNKKCIIYLSSHDECNKFVSILNKLNRDYFYNNDIFIDTIISDTSDNKRDEIINTFKQHNGKAFICSIRILDECIDIVECDSIFITKPSENKTRNIQRLCRANRKDFNNPNKISSIYLWCDEWKDCVHMIQHLKDYESSFSVDKVKIFDHTSTKNLCEKSRNNKVDYTVLDNLIIGIKKSPDWVERLDQVKKYINENKKRPSITDKNLEIKSLGIWLSNQTSHLKRNEYTMTNSIIKESWLKFIEEYKQYFNTTEEIWLENYNKLLSYLDKNNKRPSSKSKDKKIKFLGKWLVQQQINFKNNKFSKNQLSIWNNFVNKYKIYLEYDKESLEEKWVNKLNEVKLYIDKNKTKPSRTSTNKEIKSLGIWINRQQNNYRDKKCIMKIEHIRTLWDKFIDDYQEYFLSNEEQWYINIDKLKNYIDIYKSRPSSRNEDREIHLLASWYDEQNKIYSKELGIMKDIKIRTVWSIFLENYKHILIPKKEKWFISLDKLINYLDIYNTLPSLSNKDKEIKILAEWYVRNKYYYKTNKKAMHHEKNRIAWDQFIEKYKL